MTPIRVLALMESETVTGPAKNIIEFAKIARHEEEGLPPVDLRFMTFHRSGRKEGFIHAVQQAGLGISVIPERRALDTNILPKMRAAIADYAPDIIQTHNIKSHFLIKMLGLHRTYPWVAFHHGYTTTDTKMLVYNQLDRYSLRSAHHILSVCQAFCPEIIRMGVRPERITVQHNMVDPFMRPEESQLNSLRSALGIDSRTRVLLCVGRLSREKGHLDLIRAAAFLHEESPNSDFRLILLGEGPERPSIERLSQELAIRDRIIFAGYQPDVSPYFAIADVFVLPSHSEGSPNVLLEAMAAGVAAVATSVGGIPEIAVHEENALLVQKGDFKGMAKAVLRLLDDTQLRSKLIDNGRKITQKYTPALYRRRIVKIHQKVLSA